MLYQKFLVTLRDAWAGKGRQVMVRRRAGLGRLATSVQRWGVCLSHMRQPSYLKRHSSGRTP